MGIKKLMVTVKPSIEMLQENNTRKDFFEYPEYLAVRDALPDWLRPAAIFAYHMAWREENIFELTWSRVDRVNWIVRVEGDETKNEQAIEISLDGECQEMMKEQWEKRHIITKPDGND